MPPQAKRDCGVILFDVNASNKDEALTALMKICTFNWLSAVKDTYRLILTNTKKFKNSKEYSNVYDTGISDSDPQPILNYIEKAETQQGDWLNPIILAIDHLKQAFGLPGVITLQILYITKLDGCSQNADMVKVEQIINDLREYNIYLYIIGPNIKLPYTITSEIDVSDAMKDITLNESSAALEVARRIVDATTNTFMTDLKVGINLFFSCREPRGTQPWKVPLSFGTLLEIPTCTVKIYRRGAPFKLTAENKVKTSFVLVEDESVSVENCDLISGIERHGKFVKVNDSEMFKVEGPRSFAVIGFTDCNNIPEYYMREGTYYVLPDPDQTSDCAEALYNLVDVLAEEKKYAIARRVYNANTKPKFFVLVPQQELEPKCFVMSELPYADDLKQNIKFSEPEVAENIVSSDFQNFFSSIDVWDDNCKLNVPLGPKMMLDSYISKLANVAANKYLEREFLFEGLDINDLEDNNKNEFLEVLRASWPENYQPKEEVYD